MKVSVIIPTYNRAHLLTQAIDSVLNQTFTDFELIIVDNYSGDNTESVVKSYKDKRIRYFKNQNRGLIGVNRNYGIQESKGEYISFLDDDDLWLPEKLDKQVKLLDSNPGLGLVYSDIYIIGSNGNVLKDTYFHNVKPFRGNVFNELLVTNFISNLTVMVRREALSRVGMFDLKYVIAQDYDLWLRIARDYTIDFIEQPLAKYRLHIESASQKNVVLSYREEAQVKEYWLSRNPNLKRELGGRIRRRKAAMYSRMILTATGDVFRNRNKESVKEFGNLLKYLLAAKTHREGGK
jgi:glycosyltransferase involved in cell wall biosynthesis